MSRELDEKTRFNELRLREIITNYIKLRHSIKPFNDFLDTIYPDRDKEIFDKILQEITSVKYQPSLKEALYLYHKNGCTIYYLADKFNINRQTLLQRGVKYFNNEAICPRTNEKEAEELNTFFELYDIIFTKEVINNG